MEIETFSEAKNIQDKIKTLENFNNMGKAMLVLSSAADKDEFTYLNSGFILGEESTLFADVKKALQKEIDKLNAKFKEL